MPPLNAKRADTWVVLTCAACGALFDRPRSQAKRGHYKQYCSEACYQGTIKQNGANYVNSRVGTRRGRKVVSAHFAIRPGQVVHHHDGDDTNNTLTNLAVFATQAEHMRFHRGGNAQPIWNGQDHTP